MLLSIHFPFHSFQFMIVKVNSCEGEILLETDPMVFVGEFAAAAKHQRVSIRAPPACISSPTCWRRHCKRTPKHTIGHQSPSSLGHKGGHGWWHQLWLSDTQFKNGGGYKDSVVRLSHFCSTLFFAKHSHCYEGDPQFSLSCW